LRVESYLIQQIGEAYPQANLVAEEKVRDFDPEKEYTFAIDPIDGTDVFSQGMSGWCVSIGLLNKSLVPVAGIIFAPRLDLLVFADIGQKATLNGTEIEVPVTPAPVARRSNIMVSSRIHQQIDLGGYPGKIRSAGSGALHLIFPLIYPGVHGAIQSPIVHIWDIAAAHAINLSLGQDLEYLGGGQVNYSTMTNGSSVSDFLLAGTKDRIDQLRALLIKVK